MLALNILKLLLFSWVLLLIIESIGNDIITVVIISGAIITSIPLALMLAWGAGPICFRTVFLFTLFVLIIITLHVMELGLR